MASSMIRPEFQRELTSLINKHCLDNDANTPDYIIAGMLTQMYEIYRTAKIANEMWHSGLAAQGIPGPIGDLIYKGAKGEVWEPDGRKLIGPPHAHHDGLCDDRCYEPAPVDDRPDLGCVTTPDGACVSTGPCMHTEPESQHIPSKDPNTYHPYVGDGESCGDPRCQHAPGRSNHPEVPH